MNKTVFASAALFLLASPAFALPFGGTSFELPDYQPGVLAGQSNWTGTTGFTVSSQRSFSGSQSIRWSGTGGGFVSQLLPVVTDPLFYTVRLRVFIEPSGATPERVFGFRFAGNNDGVGLTINSSGLIRSGSTYNELWVGAGVGSTQSATGRWVPMELRYQVGSNRARFIVDAVDREITLSSPAFNGYSGVQLYSDWTNANLSSVAYFDDLQINAVPEPASLAVLGGALGLWGARRRRRKSA